MFRNSKNAILLLCAVWLLKSLSIVTARFINVHVCHKSLSTILKLDGSFTSTCQIEGEALGFQFPFIGHLGCLLDEILLFFLCEAEPDWPSRSTRKVSGGSVGFWTSHCTWLKWKQSFDCLYTLPATTILPSS